MKELSAIEKAKLYDEVIERGNSLLSCNELGNAWVYKLLPELKELEDEELRKEMLQIAKESEDSFYMVLTPNKRETLIALLEKQGKVKENEDSFIKWDEDERIREDLIEWIEEIADLNWLNWKGHHKRDILAWLTKQSKQKPRDKSVPKAFKELKYKDGDWIVYDNNVYKIVNIPHDNYYECLGIDNTIRVYDSCIDDKSHLWTIKDAKDGDVLVHSSFMFDDFIFIYNNTSILQAYCYYSKERDRFIIEDRGHYCPWNMQEVTPATKEQRGILFQKMKEKSYEWNEEKKELKNLKEESENCK